MKKITVIVVTYNSERHIYDCLDSVFRYNDIGEGLEVIVVDNCSHGFESMRHILSDTYGEDVRVIQNEKNGGYGQGNNVGIRIASAPIIMIMNPDVRLCEPVFERVYNTFVNNENVVMYGLTQRDEQGHLGRSVSWTSRVHPYIAEPLRFLMGKLNLYWQKHMFICGACFFIRKSSFESVGLYDENIFMYNEEDDIHGRIIKIKNAQIIYDKSLSYLHLHPAVKNFSEESHQWLINNLKSLVYLNERDGISRNKTISWSIKRTNLSIWSMQVKRLLGSDDAGGVRYFKEWRDMQKSYLFDPNSLD